MRPATMNGWFALRKLRPSPTAPNAGLFPERRSVAELRGGHSRVTHSRNPADTGGHERTWRGRRLSTGGHWRSRWDTGGHDVRPVRDREAPGSNPGPPTKNRIQNRDFAGFAYPAVSQGRSQIF